VTHDAHAATARGDLRVLFELLAVLAMIVAA